jgi:hypothetical protein
MYTYEKDREITTHLDVWHIKDPDGDILTTVLSLAEAETLLNHLNRSTISC